MANLEGICCVGVVRFAPRGVEKFRLVLSAGTGGSVKLGGAPIGFEGRVIVCAMLGNPQLVAWDGRRTIFVSQEHFQHLLFSLQPALLVYPSDRSRQVVQDLCEWTTKQPIRIVKVQFPNLAGCLPKRLTFNRVAWVGIGCSISTGYRSTTPHKLAVKDSGQTKDRRDRPTADAMQS